MKNFLSIAVNLGIVIFALAGIMAFINYIFGTNIGIKGAEVPGDPILGIIMFVFALICFGLSRLFNKNA